MRNATNESSEAKTRDRLVRAAGIKVVLTGEGADEMFAGYDLFREGKIRRFWARHPESTLRPRLLAPEEGGLPVERRGSSGARCHAGHTSG